MFVCCLFVCLDADNANGQKLSFLCLLLMNNGSLHYFLCHLYWLITVTFVLQCRAFFCTFIFPLTLYTNLQTSSNSLRLPRGWCIKFATVLNTKIDIVQKVYKWSSCPFAKMILERGYHFGKRTVWSLLFFLNYAYLWYLAQSQIWYTTLYVIKTIVPIIKTVCSFLICI